jgi:cation transport regulator ChaC
MSGLAVFGYGSLADPASAAATLGRPVEPAGLAQLEGWRRRWSVARSNRTTEKSFARADGGPPPEHIVGLTIERAAGEPGANGVLLEVTEAEAERLDLREIRYDRTEVSADVRPLGETPAFETVITYVGKRAHRFERPPPGAAVIAAYVRTVEAAFEALGPEQARLYRASTDPLPVEAIEAVLVRDEIPSGNPRAW